MMLDDSDYATILALIAKKLMDKLGLTEVTVTFEELDLIDPEQEAELTVSPATQSITLKLQ